MIYEKAVVRYEAECDYCGEYLGEFSERKEASAAIARHRLERGPHRD